MFSKKRAAFGLPFLISMPSFTRNDWQSTDVPIALMEAASCQIAPSTSSG